MSNNSSATIHVNILPIEILVRIFTLSKGYCFRDSRERLSPHNIAAVCVHWRQLATNMPSLWAHIDIGPTTPVGLTQLLLGRTKDTPVHVHVYEPQPEVSSDPEYLKHQSRKVLSVLRPHMHWICDLNIASYAHSAEFAGSVPNMWLDWGNTTLPISLLLRLPLSHGLLSVDEPNPGTHVCQSKNAERALLSINTLHLEGSVFPWNSNAYRGLIDLRLYFWRCKVSVSVSQLAGILSASPELAILKLVNLPITRTRGWTQPAPVLLSRLRLLDLNIDLHSLELLRPLIVVPTSPHDPSVAIPFDEPQHALEAFFNYSHMATPHSYYPNYYLSPRQLFLRSLPCIGTVLVLEQLPLAIDAQDTEAILASPYLDIPNMIIVSCEITLEALRVLVLANRVQKLRLQRCRSYEWIEDYQSLEDMRASLLEIFPDLSCSIEDEDPTHGLPIRQWDEHCW